MKLQGWRENWASGSKGVHRAPGEEHSRNLATACCVVDDIESFDMGPENCIFLSIIEMHFHVASMWREGAKIHNGGGMAGSDNDLERILKSITIVCKIHRYAGS